MYINVSPKTIILFMFWSIPVDGGMRSTHRSVSSRKMGWIWLNQYWPAIMVSLWCFYGFLQRQDSYCKSQIDNNQFPKLRGWMIVIFSMWLGLPEKAYQLLTQPAVHLPSCCIPWERVETCPGCCSKPKPFHQQWQPHRQRSPRYLDTSPSLLHTGHSC